MFCINKSTLSTHFLCLCNSRKGQSCFSRSLRSINFDNSPPRKSSNTKRKVKSYYSSGDYFNLHLPIHLLTKSHNRSLTVLFFNLVHCKFNCIHSLRTSFFFCCLWNIFLYLCHTMFITVL